MHHAGPERPFKKLFVYTGNTNWGVQNLEYDAHTGNYFMAVYRGKKPEFPNYPMFIVDGHKAPRNTVLHGAEPEMTAETLALAQGELTDATSGVSGWSFEFGSTGLCSLGNGFFYVSHDGHDENGWFTHVRLYRWMDGKGLVPAE